MGGIVSQALTGNDNIGNIKKELVEVLPATGPRLLSSEFCNNNTGKSTAITLYPQPQTLEDDKNDPVSNNTSVDTMALPSTKISNLSILSSSQDISIEESASPSTLPTLHVATSPIKPGSNEKHFSGDTTKSEFDFSLTEGQTRRSHLLESENELSCIIDGKYKCYIGGQYIASSLDMVEAHNITLIINCCKLSIPNYFMNGSHSVQYYSINMVDGRDDDISWFIPDVFNFISGAISEDNISEDNEEVSPIAAEYSVRPYSNTNMRGNVLIHCEKGVSRSCSFVIAYLMWSRSKYSV